jgi:hypothetical protein
MPRKPVVQRTMIVTTGEIAILNHSDGSIKYVTLSMPRQVTESKMLSYAKAVYDDETQHAVFVRKMTKTINHYKMDEQIYIDSAKLISSNTITK